ncbi:unnamed protein product [Medioppia subpectinata]|uniref:Uncharacterized protein n=1 Tax=Medioppia subpectinata TaxID=1979941 RepID=A0A7R9LXB3_9ACAR|nr:unnamed protein product [Medioppia subpectinata]CAG2122548.1 unnamed protein product [Medioppia subpectinata]
MRFVKVSRARTRHGHHRATTVTETYRTLWPMRPRPRASARQWPWVRCRSLFTAPPTTGI